MKRIVTAALNAHRGFHALPIIMLVCSLVPAPGQAQFTQQGPKLAGTGTTGSIVVEQGSSVSLSGDGNTAIVGGTF